MTLPPASLGTAVSGSCFDVQMRLPSDFTSTWARWERVHTVRTILAVLSFALVLAAFGLTSS